MDEEATHRSASTPWPWATEGGGLAVSDYEQFAQRLTLTYGELLFVDDVAHLVGCSKPHLRRRMIVSPDWRAFRARGTKLGRRVVWTAAAVAEFVAAPRSEARK